MLDSSDEELLRNKQITTENTNDYAEEPHPQNERNVNFERPFSSQNRNFQQSEQNFQAYSSQNSSGRFTKKLNIDFKPSTTYQQQQNFLYNNQIKLQSRSQTQNLPPVTKTFEELNLIPPIYNTIRSNGWTYPTPIQSVALPIALKGRDMIGIAKTGSGKTAAFIIPAFLHILQQDPIKTGDGPIALVLSPTRELAQQTDEVADKFASALNMKHVCIFGGAPRRTQASGLIRRPQLVIATPGRLIDFMESGLCPMNRCTFLVLDEADQMLDMGFEPQIRKIIGNITEDRQTLMFSATWPKEIQDLANDFLKDPVQMNIGSHELTTNPNIKVGVQKLREKVT